MKSELAAMRTAVSRSQEEVATAMGAIQADMTAKQNSWNEERRALLMQLATAQSVASTPIETPLHAIRAPAAGGAIGAAAAIDLAGGSAADAAVDVGRPLGRGSSMSSCSSCSSIDSSPACSVIATGAEPKLVARSRPRSSASSSEMSERPPKQSPSNAVTSALLAPFKSIGKGIGDAGRNLGEAVDDVGRRVGDAARALLPAGKEPAVTTPPSAAHTRPHAHEAQPHTPCHAFARLNDAEASTPTHGAAAIGRDRTPTRRSVQALQAVQPNIVLNLAPAAAAHHSPGGKVHLPGGFGPRASHRGGTPSRASRVAGATSSPQ